MAPQRSLQFMYCALLFSLCIPSTTTSTTSVPGCVNKCGNIMIPYPFGIGEKCSLAEPLAITCNRSTNSAYLDYFQCQVLKISESHVRVNLYNWSSINRLAKPYLVMEKVVQPYYTLSRARKKLVVVSCDVYAYIVNSKTRNLATGCATFCNRSDIVTFTASCAGIHCCQTSIQKDLSDFNIYVYSMNTDKKSWASDNDCNDFFIVDKDFDGFNKSMNLSTCSKNDNSTTQEIVPIILEWVAGSFSCKHARKTKDFACRENSNCVDVAGGVGYRCYCKPGFRGNPYLKQGCKGIAIAICLLILIATCFWLYRKYKKGMEKAARQKFFKRNCGLLVQHYISSSRGSAPLIKLFVLEDLEKATDNFNENRNQGKGGLFPVYKGMLSDGTIVAVKKSNIVDENQVDQFINEVLILSQISHRHIVKLLGCCLPLLVYEFIYNGTLSHHLHDEPNISTISWGSRLRIAAEIAGALDYFHSCAATTIFHQDIKSSNILLDENYRVVMHDFGLSRSVPIDKTDLTPLVGGTFGYLDPEFFRSGQLNDKSDVYAFGVVLAELLTGQQAVSSKTDERLVLRFQSAMKENALFVILDKRIETEGLEEDIVAVAKLAKRCLKLTARKRPCTKGVEAELDRIRRLSKEDLMGKQTSWNSYCSISERSFSCTTESVGEDDQDCVADN